MPAHHRLRLDDDNRIQNARPQSIEPDEEQPVGTTKPNPLRCRTAHDIELVAQDQIFGLEPFPRFEQRGKDPPQRSHDLDHRSRSCHGPPSRVESSRMTFLVATALFPKELDQAGHDTLRPLHMYRCARIAIFIHLGTVFSRSSSIFVFLSLSHSVILLSV